MVDLEQADDLVHPTGLDLPRYAGRGGYWPPIRWAGIVVDGKVTIAVGRLGARRWGMLSLVPSGGSFDYSTRAEAANWLDTAYPQVSGADYCLWLDEYEDKVVTVTRDEALAWLLSGMMGAPQ